MRGVWRTAASAQMLGYVVTRGPPLLADRGIKGYILKYIHVLGCTQLSDVSFWLVEV